MRTRSPAVRRSPLSPRQRAFLQRIAWFAFLILPVAAHAQFPTGTVQPPEGPARQNAPIDLTGYWVSIVTEDWKFRMVTPSPGETGGVPVSAAGRRAANAWAPPSDPEAAPPCEAFGAAALMRVPGRIRIQWADDDLLTIESDAGMQTRRLQFGGQTVSAAPTRQGRSVAEWQLPRWQPEGAAAGGSLKVVTSAMSPGYLQPNGVPYGADAVVTEYFNRLSAPNGDELLIVTSIVEDPVYLSRPYVTSQQFKRLSGRDGWSPFRCEE